MTKCKETKVSKAAKVLSSKKTTKKEKSNASETLNKHKSEKH